MRKGLRQNRKGNYAELIIIILAVLILGLRCYLLSEDLDEPIEYFFCQLVKKIAEKVCQTENFNIFVFRIGRFSLDFTRLKKNTMWIKKIFERSVEFKFKGITYEHINSKANLKKPGCYFIGKNNYKGELSKYSFEFELDRFLGRFNNNPSPYVSGSFTFQDQSPVLELKISKPNRQVVGHAVGTVIPMLIEAILLIELCCNPSDVSIDLILSLFFLPVFTFIINVGLFAFFYFNYTDIENDFKILERQEKKRPVTDKEP